jgi:hypothetical protein
MISQGLEMDNRPGERVTHLKKEHGGRRTREQIRRSVRDVSMVGSSDWKRFRRKESGTELEGGGRRKRKRTMRSVQVHAFR